MASGSREILGNIDDLVQIKLFASDELPPELQLQLRDVRDLLSDFRRASNGRLLVEEVNPDNDSDAQQEASTLGIYPVEFNVLRDDEFQIKRGYYGLAVLYADEQEVIPVIQRTDDLEFRLASSIRGMTIEERPGVAFMQGFGSKGGSELPEFRSLLAERYTVRSVRMAPDSTPPISSDSTQVIILAGPTQALDSLARFRIEEFVDGGGSALLLLEPILLDPQSPQPIPVFSGLDPTLERWGVHFTPSLVADLASSEQVSLGQRGFFNVVAPYPLWPIVVPSGDHITTRSLTALSLTWSGALEITDSAAVTPLWETTEAGILRSPSLPIVPDQDWNVPQSDMGVRVVAAAVVPLGEGAAGEDEDQSKGRLIVVGDASFLESQFMGVKQQNIVFAANAVDWLAQDESLIRIRSKNRTPPALAFTSDWKRNAMKWGNLAGVPLLFVAFGIFRVTGRRRRAEARWKEVIS